jgi:hypothetical protein
MFPKRQSNRNWISAMTKSEDEVLLKATGMLGAQITQHS